jgi:hypothetical protein
MSGKCKQIDICPIVKYFGKTGWRKFRRRYCEGDYTRCRRFQLRQNGMPVPIHLMPWDDSPEHSGGAPG